MLLLLLLLLLLKPMMMMTHGAQPQSPIMQAPPQLLGTADQWTHTHAAGQLHAGDADARCCAAPADISPFIIDSSYPPYLYYHRQGGYSFTCVCLFVCYQDYTEKSARRRRKHCALAMVRRSQKISPRRRLPSRGRGTAKI